MIEIRIFLHNSKTTGFSKAGNQSYPWYWFTANYCQKQRPEGFCKTRCSYKFYKFHRKTTKLESLFHKVAGLQLYSPTQVFSYEICEIFKKTYFEEYLRTNALVLCGSWSWTSFERLTYVQFTFCIPWVNQWEVLLTIWLCTTGVILWVWWLIVVLIRTIKE